MKYYIITTLSNWYNHNVCRNLLNGAGHTITYDWTRNELFGKKYSISERAEIARKEMNGVLEANFVLVLDPIGAGSHTEMGAAIAANKEVYFLTQNEEIHNGGGNIFYHHPKVIKIKYLPQWMIKR